MKGNKNEIWLSILHILQYYFLFFFALLPHKIYVYFYILSSILNISRTEFFQYEEKKVFQILLDFPTHYREFLSPLQFSPIASLTILANLCNHVLSL